MKDILKTDLLNWESGKVKGFAGKNLIDMKNGGLKMVKVDSFAEYPTHVHPNKTEFVYVLEGNPKISIGKNNYDGEKGDFFILPSSISHSIANPNETESIILVGAIKN